MDSEYQVWYLRTDSGEVDPGIVDPKECVLIGDLGPERPIVLDYRTSPTEPRVVVFAGDAWRLVCLNMQTLARELGLVPGG